MVSVKLCLALAFLLLAVHQNAVQSVDVEEIVNLNNFAIGYLTENSVLVYSKNISLSGILNQYAVTEVFWTGNHILTRVEGIDHSVDGMGGNVYSYEGGIFFHYIRLNIRSSEIGRDINYSVNIYGEPQPRNNVILGYTSHNTVLVHEERLEVEGLHDGFATATISHTANLPFSFIEILDQNSDGFGGIVSNIEDGINNRNAVVHFTSTSIGHGINFVVKFYVEALAGNDFVLGALTADSILQFSQRISVPESPGEIANGTVIHTGDRIITKIEALDQNIYQTGGFVYSVIGGVGGTNATVYFTSSFLGGTIDFVVNIYVEGNNNLTVGEINDKSILIHTTRFSRAALPNQVTYYNYSYNGDATFHKVVKVEVLDNTNDGSGGFVEVIGGGVDKKNVQLSFRSNIGRGIDFTIIIYGDSQYDANDFMLGQFKPGNVLLYRSRIFMEAYSIDVMFGSLHYRANREITMIQGFDQNRYRNGGHLVDRAISFANITLDFVSMAAGRDLDFIVEIYGI